MFRLTDVGLRRLVTAAAFALITGARSAGALELSPLAIILEQDTPIASLYLRNDTEREAAYQITALNWSQTGGADVHDRETKLIVTPPIVSLEPGESVIVRLGLLDVDVDDHVEGDFRLLIRDISQMAEIGAPLRVRTQVLLPVFRKPVEIQPDIAAAISNGADGRPCLTVHNRGNVHQKLVNLAPVDAPGEVIPVQQYVLAGQEAQVCPPALNDVLAGRLLRAGFTSAYLNKVEYHDVSHRGSAALAGVPR